MSPEIFIIIFTVVAWAAIIFFVLKLLFSKPKNTKPKKVEKPNRVNVQKSELYDAFFNEKVKSNIKSKERTEEVRVKISPKKELSKTLEIISSKKTVKGEDDDKSIKPHNGPDEKGDLKLIKDPSSIITNEVKYKNDELCKFINEQFNEHGIKLLYHFTDLSNIESIIENGGLYSYHQLSSKKINVSKFGSTEFSRSRDREKGLGDYVRLTFSRNHPMMWGAKKEGKIPNPVILKILPEVSKWMDTLYADQNAVRNNFNYGGTIEDFKKIKMNVVKQFKHFDLSEEDKPYYQAEIMIKSHIPSSMILNLKQFAI